MNQACRAAAAAGREWECAFANASYAHTAAPIFPINSALGRCHTLGVRI